MYGNRKPPPGCFQHWAAVSLYKRDLLGREREVRLLARARRGRRRGFFQDLIHDGAVDFDAPVGFHAVLQGADVVLKDLILARIKRCAGERLLLFVKLLHIRLSALVEADDEVIVAGFEGRRNLPVFHLKDGVIGGGAAAGGVERAAEFIFIVGLGFQSEFFGGGLEIARAAGVFAQVIGKLFELGLGAFVFEGFGDFVLSFFKAQQA